MIHGFTISDEIYNKLNNSINNKTIPWNKNLAGNIREEYSIYESKNLIEDFLLNQIKLSKLAEKFNFKVLNPYPLDLKIANLWVNFQKKYEFNPIHDHDGVFSFIIFMKIPFIMGDELRRSPGKNAKHNLAGHLQFFFLGENQQSHIEKIALPTDKTWEKRGLLFRSHLNHMVYPFYSSDDYRITISGNFAFDNSNMKYQGENPK